MIVVIDSSISAKWYLPEDHTEAAEKLFQGDFDLHAPEILFSEFANMLWKKRRAGDIDSHRQNVIARNFLERAITIHSMRSLVVPALLAVGSSEKPVYDWLYVMLARSLQCKFVTADRRFFLSLRQTAYKANVMWVEELL